MNHGIVRRVVMLFAGISTLTLVLSGCGALGETIPDEDRYKRVDDTASRIDYTSAGKVIAEEYQGGFLEASFFKITIEGNGSYDFIHAEILNLPNVKCRPWVESSRQLICNYGYTELYLSATEGTPAEEQITELLVRDPLGGGEDIK